MGGVVKAITGGGGKKYKPTQNAPKQVSKEAVSEARSRAKPRRAMSPVRSLLRGGGYKGYGENENLGG